MSELRRKERRSPVPRRRVKKEVNLAKLSMPRLSGSVSRPRLHKLLDDACRKSAVWIIGPGGAGKTTLTASYITERKRPFLWYQIDQDDADPATFFYYLGLAAKKIQTNRDIHLPLLTPEYLPDIPGFARRYFRALFAALPPGMVLVLDNYQDLGESATFTEIMRSAINEVPEKNNIIAVSRVAPPSLLARLRTIGVLGSLGWEELRLTLEETEAITSHNRKVKPSIIRALHERSEGWVAGLTLLLEQMKRKGTDDLAIDLDSLEGIFNFFASEFFDNLPEATREFLLRTALFSHITPTLAAEVSGNSESDKILAALHRQHFFINRRHLAEVTYQYHALFREFLLARARATYTPAQYRDLTRRVAQLLSERGRHEEAIGISLQAKDWETATPLILAQAPMLIAQGRTQTVAAWIQQLPEEIVASTPWLMFWKGVCLQFVNPVEARKLLEETFAVFYEMGDMLGQLLTASAIIDIVHFLRGSPLAADRWIKVLQDNLAKDPIFPSPSMEAKILSSLFSILLFYRPQDSQLPRYANRLIALLGSDLDVSSKVFAIGHLLQYYTLVNGDLKTCDTLMIHLKPLLDSPGLTVLTHVYGRHMHLFPYFLAGRIDEAYKFNQSLVGKVIDNNLYFFELIARIYDAIVYLNLDKLEEARLSIDRMFELLNSSQPMDVTWSYMAKCMHEMCRGDYSAALSHGQTALHAVSKIGVSLIEMDVNCLIAIALCESGMTVEALGNLDACRKYEFSNHPRTSHQIFLIEAYAYLLQLDRSKCHERLRKAFAIGRIQHYFGSVFCWYPRMFTRLCAEALRAGIEVAYAQELIRKRKLLPEDPTIENWPWPIRIYTLGQFNVLIDGKPLTETKAHRKPLNLLEALIALGGNEVKIERITEILWPEAEGDAAHSAFTTTLSRLRKLIGEEAIRVKSGRVTLDERRCWWDVRSFDYLLDQTEKFRTDPSALNSLIAKVIALYQGPFLSDEEGAWSRRLRNRLRSKLSIFLMQSARTLHGAGEREQAVRLLGRALELDPNSEHMYRNLISGYSIL